MESLPLARLVNAPGVSIVFPAHAQSSIVSTPVVNKIIFIIDISEIYWENNAI